MARPVKCFFIQVRFIQVLFMASDTVSVDGEIIRNGKQPGLWVIKWTIVLQMTAKTEERFLRQIFRSRRVVSFAEQITENR